MKLINNLCSHNCPSPSQLPVRSESSVAAIMERDGERRGEGAMFSPSSTESVVIFTLSQPVVVLFSTVYHA